MESTSAGGADRPLDTDVLRVAASLRWSRPDLTAALSEYRSESAAAESDRDAWLESAGWRLYAAAATGDGREVASDVMDGLPRWGTDALRLPAAGRLRIELAVLAHETGEARASRALLHAVPVEDADREFAADVVAAAARCSLADAAPSEAALESTLAAARTAWAAVGGARGELGAASVQAVGAAAARRAGYPDVAVKLAVDGLSRLDRGRAGPDALTPSGHLAAALAAEWIAALIDAGRPEQARGGSGPLQDRLVEYARPSRQLALLRLTIARATASRARPRDVDAAGDLERAAADAAASDVPALEHVCRTALGEVYESAGRPAESVESIRRAVEADRRHRRREARFRTALTRTQTLWRVDVRHTRVADVVTPGRNSEPVPDPAGTAASSSAPEPLADNLFASDVPNGPGRRHSTNGNGNGNGNGSGTGRTAILRAVQAASMADRDQPLAEAGGSGTAQPDPWATGTWSATRPQVAGRDGADPVSGRTGPPTVPPAVEPTGARSDLVDAGGVDPDVAGPAVADGGPTGPATTGGDDITNGSPGRGEVPPNDSDTWLATALAELDRIWRSGDASMPVPAEVHDDVPVAVEMGDCVVVLDLAMAGERLAAEAAAPTVRRLVRRLEDRLPPASRLRDDGPDIVSVVLTGRDRESAAEWLHRVLPDLVDGLAVDAAVGGALLRAAVHDTDGSAGGQILQQLDGTRGRNGASTQKDRPAARHEVEMPRPDRPVAAESHSADRSGAFAVSGAVGAGVAGNGAVGTAAAGTVPAGEAPAGTVSAGTVSPRGEGPGAPAPPRPAADGVPHDATAGARSQTWTSPAVAPKPSGTAALLRSAGPAAVDEPLVRSRPETRHDQSGERRPYLPAGVVVRPGTGGRRHRRPEEPAPDAVVRDGPGSSSALVPAAARNVGRPSPGRRDERPPDAGPSNVSEHGVRPEAGSGNDAEPPAPEEIETAARAEESDGLGLPSPDGLGLADLLAGALAAYRRI